jgi:hypothetical protein
MAVKVGTVRIAQGEHNKPSGCSASAAYAPCPGCEEEEEGACIYWVYERV